MARFLTSARAVDMLGRQQIAGIPTAISELFKNSYDAYATSVRADYFPDRRTLILRDNGIGMSESDFVSRWLTVGTDSKARDSSTSRPPKPSGVQDRRQMGEKGIGRLAIASIGPQVLVVTRTQDLPDEVVVALVQWSMFEAPGLTLDDVVVPMRVVRNLESLDTALIDSLIEELRGSLHALGARLPASRAARIGEELDQLPKDVRPFLAMHGPNLAAGGTAFIIGPVREELDDALHVPSAQEEITVSSFQRFLAGFTNTMNPPPGGNPLGTRFIVHRGSTVTDLIDPSKFWQPEDFDLTDHTIEGEFDEQGLFQGFASIYGAEPVPFTQPWTDGRGRRTRCGAFKIKFGYVQGDASDSRLSADDFALMTGKLNRIGGLYVYRDSIRVLPYGNADVDYLEIEKRRTLKASRYFFSYRRMFGAIDVSGEANPDLQEKAGREGFRENGAYSDFKSLLINLLVQTAATYFSTETDEGSSWAQERNRLKRRSSSRSGQEARERRQRDRFAQQLEEVLALMEAGEVGEAVSHEVDAAARALKALPPSASARDIVRIETTTRKAIESHHRRISLARPAGLAMTSSLEREWLSYERMAEGVGALVSREVARLSRAVERAAANAGASKASKALHESRLAALHASGAERSRSVQAAGVRVDAELSRFDEFVGQLVVDETAAFSASLETLLEQIDKDISLEDDARYLAELDTITVDRLRKLDEIYARLVAYRETGFEFDDNVLLQEQVLDLQDQLDANLELMQLGQTVQIVSHEFESSIRAVRSGLQDLAPWARSTPRLAPLVRDLRAAFAHLDGYLRLFTPLQRRLYRQAVVLTGKEIAEFVNRVFADRLARHDVRLEVSDVFESWRIRAYPSTFYPVFVNLVDNAIFWASTGSPENATIWLDADDNALYVRDNGPGVHDRDRDAIFERGFSRRRGGRGLGLALAADLLDREGWSLTYDERWSQGASFRIEKVGTSE